MFACRDGIDVSVNNNAMSSSPIPDLRVPVFFTVIGPALSWPKCSEPISGFLRLSDKLIAIYAYIEMIARWGEMHFALYFGSGLKQLLHTWVCLSLGKPIPLSRQNVKWAQSEVGGPHLLISPCWPADFSIRIWFQDPHEIEPTFLLLERMWARGGMG